MALDKVQPLKLEDPGTGGSETDQFPTELDPKEDFVECAGAVLDDATHQDESTVIWRADLDMKFKDGNNPSGATLTELLAGGGGMTESQHKALRHLIHFISDGPGDGFASGSYKEVTGTVFPSSIVWWTSVVKVNKIVERLCTWSGAKLTVDQWKIYDSGGVLLVTLTDAISYTGIFETSRTRTIS